MSERMRSKFFHEGEYAAEVQVRLIDDDTGRSPIARPRMHPGSTTSAPR